MKISATEAGQADVALFFLDKGGALGRWWLLDSAGVIVRGESGEPLPSAARAILAVPGEEVAVHWLDLAEGLARPQAAAAARLLLADSSADPIALLHVAVGRAEQGRTPVALVPASTMADWLAAASASGMEPNSIIPTPLLLPPPDQGFVRYDRGDIADYRGFGSAFSLEPALAETLPGASEAEILSVQAFEAHLGTLLADPPLDLRQGAFALRRAWHSERGPARRIAILVLALLILTLAIQVTLILRYTFAADALEAEKATLTDARSARSINFTVTAGALFDAIRATPNVELTRLEYRPDGGLTAAVQGDNAAILAALHQRAQASGLDVELGPARNSGGRQAADLTVRP